MHSRQVLSVRHWPLPPKLWFKVYSTPDHFSIQTPLSSRPLRLRPALNSQSRQWQSRAWDYLMQWVFNEEFWAKRQHRCSSPRWDNQTCPQVPKVICNHSLAERPPRTKTCTTTPILTGTFFISCRAFRTRKPRTQSGKISKYRRKPTIWTPVSINW
jgi:hypothetical protein